MAGNREKTGRAIWQQFSKRHAQTDAARVAGLGSALPWWTAVIITASSKRQAERYEWEIYRRLEKGRIPEGTRFLVVPDLGDQRIGSGSATLHALRTLAVEGSARQ